MDIGIRRKSERNKVTGNKNGGVIRYKNWERIKEKERKKRRAGEKGIGGKIRKEKGKEKRII